jgi:hypothetical protein
MNHPLVTVLAPAAAALAGVLVKTVFQAALTHERVKDVWSSLTWKDALGLGLFAAGAVCLLFSYQGWLWDGSSREEWWEGFTLEMGGGLVFVGALDTLLLARVNGSDRDQQP